MKIKKQKLNKGMIFQKKRYSLNMSKLKLRFGESGFYFFKENRIELIYLVYLRKLIKKIGFPKSLKKLKNVFLTKVWFFLKKNFPITKKSKNSRMGKGKGKFLRWIIRVQKNFIFFEFKGYEFFLLKKIAKKINKKNLLFIKLYYNYQSQFINMGKHRHSVQFSKYYAIF